MSFRHATLLLIPTLFLAAACGGGDDDDDDDESGGSSSSSSANSRGDSSNRSIEIPNIKDGNFGKATVHVEVSGGKDTKLDLEGNALATGGFVLLTFAGTDGSVQISLQGGKADEAGGVSLTTRQLATAGGWGADCSVKVSDGDRELRGEFECKEIEAIEPGATKVFKVRLKGSFTASR